MIIKSKEAPYFKLYDDVFLKAFGTHGNIITLFFLLAKAMTYANDGQIVILDRPFRAEIRRTLNISAKTLQRNIKTCVDIGAILRLDTDIYMVNPYIVSKGAWKHVRRAQIDYVNLAIDRGISVPTDNKPLPLPGDRII